jgi:hypothetical protein
MIAKKATSNKNEDEMRTIATEARSIPERTNNNEGRGADLQITQRRPFTPESGPPSAKTRGGGIRVDLHDNGFGFDDSPGKSLAVK